MNLSEKLEKPAEKMREAAARGLAHLHVTANTLTVAGLLVNIGAGILFGLGRFPWAAAVTLLASLFDFLDGAVARVTGKTSRFGALLDSTLDRYSDTAVLAGITVHYLYAGEVSTVLLGLSAIVGGVLVSYARARAECFIPSCKVGFFERPERLVVVVLGGFGGNMPTALWALATLTHWTVLVRLHHTWRTLAGRAAPPANTFAGQFYHILFWDFRRGTIQHTVLAALLSACILWLPM